MSMWLIQYGEVIGRYVLLVALVCLPAKLVFRKNNPNNAGAAIVAAAIGAALLLTRLPDISSFHLLGLTAQLEQQRQKVEITLAQLQKLAASLAEGSLNDLAFSGHVFVGMSTAEKFRIRDGIVGSLNDIGVNSQDIRKTQQLWIYVYCDMLVSMIEGTAKQLLPAVDVDEELRGLPKSKEEERLPSPDTLRKWVASKSLHNPYVDQLLKEYENVWANGTMQNPDLIPFGSEPRATELEKLPAAPGAMGGPWNNGGILSTDQPLPSPQQHQ